MSPETKKVLEPSTTATPPKTPYKISKRKDAPATIVSPPSKKGRLQKAGGVNTKRSKVKIPTAPKCQPGGMLLNWPPDPPKMSTIVTDSSNREEGRVAVENKTKMINGSPPSSPEASKGGDGTSALLTELAELNLDVPKTSNKAQPKESMLKSKAGGRLSNVNPGQELPSASSDTPARKRPTKTISAPSKNTRARKATSGTGKEASDIQVGATSTEILPVASSVTAVQEEESATPGGIHPNPKRRNAVPRLGAGKEAFKVQKAKPKIRRDVEIPSSDAAVSSGINPTQEGPSNTPVSITPKKPSVKKPAATTSKAKTKNVNPEAPPAEATPAQEDAPISSVQKKPRPKKAATGTRKAKGKPDNIPQPSVAEPDLPITPNQSFNGTPDLTNEAAAPKEKLSEVHKFKNSNSKVAEVPVAAPLVPVVYKNGKPVRRIQPTPVTGNTSPPSPKIRLTEPARSVPEAPRNQISGEEAGTQADGLSVLVVQNAPRVYKSPYALVPSNPSPVEKPTVQENAIAPSLPTPPAPQLEREEQDVSSQASSLQDSSSQRSVSQVPSSRSSSFKPYRRKALPPTHLPGGLGARIHDKPLPKGISKPTAQQIINIITPGVQRRGWGEPPRIPDEKALEMIEEIFQAKALEGGTVYDILRLPIYSSWEEHRGNYDKLIQCLQEETAGGGRVVLGVKYIKQAYSTISSPQLKAAYDRTLKVQTPNQGLMSPPPAPRLAGVIEGPPHTPSFHDLGDDRGSGAQGLITMAFRVYKPIRMPMQTHPSFWTALAYGIWGDIKYWGSIKAATLKYWNSVVSTPEHPRRAGYKVMHDYGLSIGDASMQNQLEGEYDVTPEIWQVVADNFSIELLAIIDTPYTPPVSSKPSSAKPPRPTLTVVPRGSHNSRQIFILFNPATRDYEPVFPVRNIGRDWRYEKHMPLERIGAPQGDTIEKAEKEKKESDTRRCPFLERDEKGVFIEPVSRMEGYEGEIEAPGALVGGGGWGMGDVSDSEGI